MKTTALILAAFVIIGMALAIRTEARQAGEPAVVAPAPVPADKNPAPNAPKMKKTWQVKAWGIDQKAAVERALKTATAEVRDYLRGQAPPFEWLPSADYVKKHLLQKGEPERLPDLDYAPKDKDKDQKWECWAVTVEVTLADFEAMRRENDLLILSGKQGERMSMLARITGLLLAGLLLTLGYLRLEDRTKGYLSRWLLVGAVGALVLVGAGLFLVL